MFNHKRGTTGCRLQRACKGLANDGEKRIIILSNTVNKYGFLRNIVRNTFILKQTLSAETAAIAFFVPIRGQVRWKSPSCN